MARFIAWHVAALGRTDAKHFPSAKEFIPGPREKEQKNPALQRAHWRDWAAVHGIKVEKVKRG